MRQRRRGRAACAGALWLRELPSALGDRDDRRRRRRRGQCSPCGHQAATFHAGAVHEPHRPGTLPGPRRIRQRHGARADALLPGVARKDVKVTVEDGVPTLSGERQYQKEDKSERFHRPERFQGSFARSLSLPDCADASAISAESKDGTLAVHIPKTESAKPKAIEVKVA
ncbi:MAG: Hsp20/alpha crystallin family protein [Gammaproteobacteria bacterium]